MGEEGVAWGDGLVVHATEADSAAVEGALFHFEEDFRGEQEEAWSGRVEGD